ncbi:MAG: hypothetical protein NDJ75_07290 [Thermoanaerobaculia bacterium]|nr:hypothetical protein [Thermoanaerobaculia bacterium]
MRAPEISVILVTERFDTVRDVVRCLVAQTMRDRLELVLVTGAAAELGPRDDLAALAAVQIVEVGAAAMAEVHPARVAGIHAARAPIVAFGETHSFPEPDFCAELLAAHRGGDWVAVGPGMLNANPESVLSWSGLLLDYGAWLAGAPGGPCEHVAGHNGAYRREPLLAYGDELAELMRADTVLTARLHADGHRFYFAPAARTRHLNVSRPRSWILERFAAGREFAAARVADAAAPRRLLFVAGAPLIPAVRLLRILRLVARLAPANRPPLSSLPALVGALLISGAGELCGYAFGSSDRGRRHLAEIEIYRARHVDGWSFELPAGPAP